VAKRESAIVVRRDLLALPSSYVSPRSVTESKLAEIWRDCLSLDCVGIHDDYETLGGDSFLAAIIFTQIEAEFKVSLPMATLVEAPTIEQLAAKLEAAMHKAGWRSA